MYSDITIILFFKFFYHNFSIIQNIFFVPEEEGSSVFQVFISQPHHHLLATMDLFIVFTILPIDDVIQIELHTPRGCIKWAAFTW